MWNLPKVLGLRQLLHFDNYAQLIVNRIFFRTRPINIYVLGKYHILVDHAGGDANGTRACLASPMYSSLLKEIHLPKTISVLDIGANGGGFPLLLATMGYSFSALTCVEMNPRVFSRLRFNITSNLSCANTNLLNAAVWGDSATLTLNLGRGSTGESVVNAASAVGEKVQALSLNEIIERSFPNQERIDICKIDVEGAEFPVFKESNNSSISRCAYVIIEIHESFGERRLVDDRLQKLGFTLQPRVRGQEREIHVYKNQLLGEASPRQSV